MITLYNENDVQIRDIRIYEINDADMGESTITATVKFDQVMQFHPDWYVLLNGEKYKLGVTEPSGKRSTTRINVEYTLTFHSSREDLKRYTFMDFVEYGSGNPQPSQHTFSLQACTLGQLVNRFNINLQYYLGSLWTMELSDDADPSIVADLSFDKASLWDVLLELYKDYGVRWTIHSDEGYMTILVGEDATELQTIFEYGKGNGLISVERTNPTERIVTRLRGKGSEKNLPANYFHAATSAFPIADPDTNNILQGIFYNRLYPKCYRDYVRGYNSGEEDEEETWAYQQGVADKVAGKPMNIVDFAKSDNEDLWGISYGAVEDNDEIFPTLQGATRDGVELDKVLAVSPIYVDAPDDGEAARQFTQVNGAKGSFQGRDYRILIGGRDGGISSVVGISNAKSATADSATFTLETAINTVRAKFLVTPTKFADYYANGAGVTDPESPTLTTVSAMVANNWNFVERLQLINATTNVVVRTWNGNNQDFFDVVADDIPAGTYKFRSYIQWYKTTGTTSDKLLYTIDWQLYGCEYASYQNASSKKTFSETFDIWIGNVWNTAPYENESDEAYACRVWAPLVSKEEMTVMFSDGLLAGEDYEFPIVGLVNGSDNLAEIIKKAIHYDTSVTGSHWRLTLRKSDAEFEASGKYLPNSVINVLPGNHFFFINIQMPYDPYIYDAERRQQEYLEDQLSLLDVEQPTFAVVPSSVFMASLDEVDDVVPGNKIRLRDTSLIGSSYTTAYIQSISKRYTENKINPDWSLVVSDQIIVNGNPITLIEGKVDALSKQMYSSKQAIKDAIEAFAQFYLRKDGLPDASFSTTDFRAPVTFRDRITDYNFRQGDFGGYGFGVYTDPDGNRVVEADVLVGRMALRVNELIVNQVEYVGGQKIYSAAAMTVSKVESTTTIWRCYFDNKQGAVRNMFLAGDLAFCQRFNGTEEGGYTTYWAKVTAIGSDYIELSKTDIMSAGSGSPAVGDNIIQLGNVSDQDRQSAIILSSYGANSPSIRLYHGITGYTLANKDVFGVEYDSTNHIPYFYNYGSMRLGARESDANGQFITYNHLTGTLNIRAKVNFIGGSSGLTNLTEYPGLNARINTAITAAAAAQEIMEALNDDSIFDNVEKRSVRRQWEAINGAASTTSAGTTGSYHQTITDFDSYAFPTQQALFTFNGVTYTYAQKGLLHTAIGIDDLIEKYTNLRNYLDLVGLYDEEEYTDFSPSTLGTKLTAYYDAEQHVRNQVDLDNKQKFDTLSYLKGLLTPGEDVTTIDGGVILSSIIGVRGESDSMIAALNSSSLGEDSVHGKLLLFAGVSGMTGSTFEQNVRNSSFKVYQDGSASLAGGNMTIDAATNMIEFKDTYFRGTIRTKFVPITDDSIWEGEDSDMESIQTSDNLLSSGGGMALFTWDTSQIGRTVFISNNRFQGTENTDPLTQYTAPTGKFFYVNGEKVRSINIRGFVELKGYGETINGTDVFYGWIVTNAGELGTGNEAVSSSYGINGRCFSYLGVKADAEFFGDIKSFNGHFEGIRPYTNEHGVNWSTTSSWTLTIDKDEYNSVIYPYTNFSGHGNMNITVKLPAQPVNSEVHRVFLADSRLRVTWDGNGHDIVWYGSPATGGRCVVEFVYSWNGSEDSTISSYRWNAFIVNSPI